MFCKAAELAASPPGWVGAAWRWRTQPDDSWKVASATPAVSIIAPICICARSRSSSTLRSSTAAM